MKIQPIQNNNTNFQGLHVDKKIYHQLGMGRSKNIFLKNPEIKKCADSFEVLVEKGKPIKRNKIDSMMAFIEQFSASSIGMCVGIGIGAILPAYVGTSITLTHVAYLGMIGGILGLAGATGHIIKKNNGNDYEYNLQVGKNIKQPLFGKKELLTPLTNKYPIIKYLDLKQISDIFEQAKINDEQKFINIINRHKLNNLLEPKNILAILEDKRIKQRYSNGEAFNYKLTNNNDDTLLTKFFDIVPTNENIKDYTKILEIMKNTKNINYNQKDSNEISIIEKILNSENLETLDFVKNINFNYQREIDFAFKNIKNLEFKYKIKNLKIQYPNIMEAIEIGTDKALEAVFQEFKSPFCNIGKILNNSYNKVPLNNFNNVIRYLNAHTSNLSNKKRKNYEHFKQQHNML